MMLSKRTSLNFNNVHILSDRPSIVTSRNDITIPMDRIIMAPMHAIQGPDLIKAAIQAGISVPIHRFCSIEEQRELLKIAINMKKLVNSNSILWLSVGMNDYAARISMNKEYTHSSNTGILLDVANGYNEEVNSVLKNIRKLIGSDLSLFAGNVHTSSGFAFLEEHCDFIRAGIGPGEACLTTTNTGVGRGQITVIDDIAEGIRTAAIVSDGGIRGSGDLAKAFGAGADYVMIGGLFKHALEAECVKNNTTFFGGASAKAKQSVGLPIKHIEGTEVPVDQNNIKPLEKILEDLTDGLRSAISYSGFDNLESYIGNAKFEVKL